MNIVRFRPEHMARIRLQPWQEGFSSYLADCKHGEMLDNGNAFSAIYGDHVIGCAGVVELWDNRAIAWTLLSEDSGKHFVSIHRAVAGFLKAAKWRRIEATVDVGFDAGERWMGMLGFQREGLMRAYTPDGRDQQLFARVTK